MPRSRVARAMPGPARRRARQRRGVEALEHLPRSSSPSPARASPPSSAATARGSSSRERHRAVALGEPRAVRRRARAARARTTARGRPSASAEEAAGAASSLEQVVAAHDLADLLPRVVDDHGEVVGGRAVVAAHDEVVDHALLRAVHAVVEGDPRCRPARTRSAGGRPPRALAPPLGRRQAQARARVGALRQRPVRRRGGGADLGPRAEALVQPARRRAAGRSPPRRRRGGWTGTRPRRPSRGPAPAGRAAAARPIPARTRPWSRSSIRTRKRAPAERAKSQASSAVRRLPRCSVPVGLGAKRPLRLTRTEGVSAISASRGAVRSRSEYSSSMSLRPAHAHLGVVEADARLGRRVVVRRALVDEVGRLGQHAEAVPEADGDVELEAALVVELDRLPLAERRRAAAQVDGDVEHAAARDAHELALAGPGLEVDPAQRAAARARVVVLDELRRNAVRPTTRRRGRSRGRNRARRRGPAGRAGRVRRAWWAAVPWRAGYGGAECCGRCATTHLTRGIAGLVGDLVGFAGYGLTW